MDARTAIAGIFIGLLITASPTVLAKVYQCDDGKGGVLFQSRPCGGAMEDSENLMEEYSNPSGPGTSRSEASEPEPVEWASTTEGQKRQILAIINSTHTYAQGCDFELAVYKDMALIEPDCMEFITAMMEGSRFRQATHRGLSLAESGQISLDRTTGRHINEIMQIRENYREIVGF